MLSASQLNNMLSLQDKMNKKVNSEWITAGYQYLRAAMIEGVEGIEHHGWKWWKAQEKDLAQLQMELVDIWHFALSHVLIEHKGNSEVAARDITEQLSQQNTNVTFDGRDYDVASQDLLSNLQLMVGLCAANRFDVPLFIRIIEQCEMDADSLYKQYVGKNVLNFFRQDHGYKAGTYIKVWNGKEDNEYLVETLNQLNVDAPDYAQLIYQSLSEHYPA